MSGGAEAAAPGYHGKLVAKGDFVTRRLPRSFLDPWDSWLQDVVGGSRARMGETWLDAYLTSPIWRFTVAAGLCGSSAAAGVLMPSVDRVGRYFPLTIVALLPEGADPVGVPVAAGAWFGKAEALAQSALDDAFDFDRFDADVAALGPPDAAAPTSDPGPRDGGERGLRLPIPSADAVEPAYRHLAGRFLAAHYPEVSFWWTSGSEAVGATFLVCRGLPSAEGFAAFLDGRWSQWGWDGDAPAAPAPAEAGS
ncbi:MAG: type VI secretion system-associated protein TagF [Dongiaceae bacterium]